MKSIKETILEEIKTRLKDIPELEGRVLRSRMFTTDAKDLPMIIVESIRTVPDMTRSTAFTDWTLTVRILLLVMHDEYEVAADPILSAIYHNLMKDQTLGGLLIDLLPVDMEFKPSDKEQPVGGIDCTYELKYRTSQTDITR